MSPDELSRLKTTGELFVTRNFVSTSTEEDVACMFCGESSRHEDKVSVLISMHIDREEVTDKPIAFIQEYSQFPWENEVMLPMGMVFRTVSYEEVNKHLMYSVKIKMIRGKEEQEFEKGLIRFHLLIAGSPFLGMDIFLKSIQHGQYCEAYRKLMSDALKSSNAEVAEDSNENATVPSIGEGMVNTNPVFHTAKLTAIFQRTLTRWIVIFVSVLIIVAAIVTPISIVFAVSKYL
jgi:hypothetical protein